MRARAKTVGGLEEPSLGACGVLYDEGNAVLVGKFCKLKSASPQGVAKSNFGVSGISFRTAFWSEGPASI